ncbi:MAG: adenine phosphoribosyltransferase [Planctomycetota bacterium]|nr:MAG: adenine phosphoribosyltransferase [Planctomycetota bacterium]
MTTTLDLRNYIRDIPDFPKPGILFKDITPLLASPEAFSAAIDRLTARYENQQIDAVVAAESRGFIFGAPLALRLSAAFVPVRKPGKLPFDTHSHSYDLEYGSDTLEIHQDALTPGARVVVVDDLLATGGTLHACLKLLEKFNDIEIVECAFCIHLTALKGEQRLAHYPIFSLIQY